MYGEEFALKEPRVFTKKTKGAQEAHEAIRPTDLSRTPESLKDHLDPRQYRLYKLIWERAAASQMPPAKLDVTTVTVTTESDITLIAKGQIIKFAGFMRAYIEGTDHPEEALANKETLLPEIEKGEECKKKKINSEQKFTQPPARYSEATLVKKLESEGIGRPSTYAPTISTIVNRGYIEKQEDKKLHPLDIGKIVSDFLVKHFGDIVDYHFTAELEEKLDHIAAGEVQWEPVIKEFYKPFIKTIEEKKKSIKKEDVITEKTDEICDLCKAPMQVKLGRNGKFLSCSKYPECKNAKPMKEDREREAKLQKEFKDEKCDKCDSAMVVKKGRYGDFLACSAYPNCKSTRPMTHSLDVFCPKCKKKLTEKRTKRGKVFYGCSAYPDCDFATWSKPIEKPCPVCKGLQVQAKKDLIKCEQCGKETEVEEE
jgi:DNA topoisomerase-1